MSQYQSMLKHHTKGVPLWWGSRLILHPVVKLSHMGISSGRSCSNSDPALYSLQGKAMVGGSSPWDLGLSIHVGDL